MVGLETNIEFLKRLSANQSFVAGQVETGFIPKHHSELFPPNAPVPAESAALAAIFSIVRALSNVTRPPPGADSCAQEGEKAASRRTSDPWQAPSLAGWRMNEHYARQFHFLDREHKLPVSVTYHDGGYTVRVRDQTLQAKATSLAGALLSFIIAAGLARSRRPADGILSAEIGGVKCQASCVSHNNKLYIFAHGQTVVLGLEPTDGFKGEARQKSSLLAPMPGKIIKLVAKTGEFVKKGAPLVILEAMKMEHVVRAPYDGEVKAVLAEPGQIISQNATLINLAPTTA